MTHTFDLGPNENRGIVLTVAVRDLAGGLTDVAFPDERNMEWEFTTADPRMANPAGQPNVVRVAWQTGTCDTHATIEISKVDSGRLLTFESTPDCDIQGIPVPHFVDLTFNQPVAAESIALHLP